MAPSLLGVAEALYALLPFRPWLLLLASLHPGGSVGAAASADRTSVPLPTKREFAVVTVQPPMPMSDWWRRERFRLRVRCAGPGSGCRFRCSMTPDATDETVSIVDEAVAPAAAGGF